MAVGTRFCEIWVLLLTASCASGVSEQRFGDLAATEREMQLALFRYLADTVAPMRGRVGCFGVFHYRNPSINGRPRLSDADEEMLAALRVGGLEAVELSECGSAGPTAPLLHVPTGRRAVIYTVSDVGWVDGRPELNGSWSGGAFDGESCTYWPRVSGTGWRFAREENCIVA